MDFKNLLCMDGFWLLVVESCDFSQDDKEITACKAGQVYKIKTILTQNDNLGQF
jgi:hypothetical protein